MDFGKIYLDYNATTPLAKEVAEEITSALYNGWGNASSNHKAGIYAKELIQKARENVASVINASSSDIIFTSGGTEGNNWVIDTAVKHFNGKFHSKSSGEGLAKPHIITSNVEHDSVTLPLRNLEKRGVVEISWLPVDSITFVVCKEIVLKHIKQNTCLVTIMMANNETGVIMPVEEIFKAVKQKAPQILLHTDAAQAFGKIGVDVQRIQTDFLTIVGHKFYGPRIGALYVRGLDKKETPFYPLFYGGGQERNYRPGTENTPMIVGLGKACSLISQNLDTYSNNMQTTRNYLATKLKDSLQGKVTVNCECSNRLPNTLNVSFIGANLQGFKVVQSLKTFCCSTGSACHSNVMKSSQILLRFHVTEAVANNALRISTGRETTLADIDVVVEELKQIINHNYDLTYKY